MEDTPNHWFVKYEHLKLDIFLENKTFITEDGFGMAPSVYPVTVVQARYQGSYEGSSWLCFPTHPHKLQDYPWQGWDGSDIQCMDFWHVATAQEWPIGHGGTPSDAYNNLVAIVCRKAGLDLAALCRNPTWDRDELQQRDN